jgi:hypothetical protein
VLVDHPDTTPRAVYQTWGNSDRTPGGMLRTLLPEVPTKPSIRTLEEDFRALRERGEN